MGSRPSGAGPSAWGVAARGAWPGAAALVGIGWSGEGGARCSGARVLVGGGPGQVQGAGPAVGAAGPAPPSPGPAGQRA